MGGQTEPGRGDECGGLCGGSERVLGVQGDEDGLDQSTWFQRCKSVPQCGRWRTRVCLCVYGLTEQVGEPLCQSVAWSRS